MTLRPISMPKSSAFGLNQTSTSLNPTMMRAQEQNLLNTFNYCQVSLDFKSCKSSRPAIPGVKPNQERFRLRLNDEIWNFLYSICKNPASYQRHFWQNHRKVYHCKSTNKRKNNYLTVFLLLVSTSKPPNANLIKFPELNYLPSSSHVQPNKLHLSINRWRTTKVL